jgi:hypothetical protein
MSVLSRIYDAINESKNELFHIHIRHKKWGNEWYELVLLKSYDNAKIVLASRGKGEDMVDAMDCIDEIARLEMQMRMIERYGL